MTIKISLKYQQKQKENREKRKERYIKKISYHNKYLEKGYHNSVANSNTVINIKI